MTLFKRSKLPDEGRPELVDTERIMAWAPVVEGAFLVATNAGLWVTQGQRLGWHEISKATWSGEVLTVIPGPVTLHDEVGVVVEEPRMSWLLETPGKLPRQVQERVTRSVAYSSHHLLPGQPGGVRVLARRVPGLDGLLWGVRYDEGVDPTDPAVAALTTELVTRAQQEM
ncbi:MAG: hypothetical protein H0T78_08885 [Longispora sp.]|nr:hypothetical protein [Longispora sp. (in: high G+C Gram-positive bacteria)]